MAICSACRKQISGKEGDRGIRERDHVYHIACAPNDLLDDAASEWSAILDRGVRYFVKKYSPRGVRPGGRAAYIDHFADMGKEIAAETSGRKK